MCFVYLFQIITLLNFIEAFSSLGESKIEGLESYASRFQQILTNIRKKPYDILDQRKVEFDQDYVDFRRQLADLEVGIEKFLDNSFKKVPSTMHALQLLERLVVQFLPILHNIHIFLNSYYFPTPSYLGLKSSWSARCLQS